MMHALLLANVVERGGLVVGFIGWSVLLCGIMLVLFFLRKGIQKSIPPETHRIRDALRHLFNPRRPHGHT